ncbi:hypothetical protein [Sphingobacterium thalpophilum]|uniref:hypothetical protein n=1 Tax=Sphingobacterium thalpophilum TaxID=259 RepID=UPI003D99BD8B
MEQKPIDLEKAVMEMANLFRQYGYRNSFTITMPKSGQPKFTGKLNDCLNRFLAATIKRELSSSQGFELETWAPYSRNILCRFHMDFDKQEGFKVHKMEVINLKVKLTHEFRLRSNREMPGAQTLEGMFPKPKPWDFLKKGKLRP